MNKFYIITFSFLFFNNCIPIVLDFKVGEDILKGDNRAFVRVEFHNKFTRVYSLGANEELKIEPREEDNFAEPRHISIEINLKDIEYGIWFRVQPDHYYTLAINDPKICSKAKPLSADVKRIGDKELLCLVESETKLTGIETDKHKNGNGNGSIETIEIK